MHLVRLVHAFVQSMVAVASAQLAASNASDPSSDEMILVPTNSTYEGLARATSCAIPSGAIGKWWYNTRNDGPYNCYSTNANSVARWSMLNSYRSGGRINIHWKYSDDTYDMDCLKGWTYYSADGNEIIAQVHDRITWAEDTRSWCALPVYRSGGAEGNQWDWCHCWSKG
jgi:hypothetical protein